MSQIVGHISQIIGPVIDVYFDTTGLEAEKVLPKIYEALKVERADGSKLIIEVQQHIGEDCRRKGWNYQTTCTCRHRRGRA